MPKPSKLASDECAPVDPSSFLTIKDVATKLRVHERTVWRLIKFRKIKVHRFGGSVRIEATELERYIRECAE